MVNMELSLITARIITLTHPITGDHQEPFNTIIAIQHSQLNYEELQKQVLDTYKYVSTYQLKLMYCTVGA